MHRQVPLAQPPIPPAPTGVDYLGLVLTAHDAETLGELAFRDLHVQRAERGQLAEHLSDAHQLHGGYLAVVEHDRVDFERGLRRGLNPPICIDAGDNASFDVVRALSAYEQVAIPQAHPAVPQVRCALHVPWRRCCLNNGADVHTLTVEDHGAGSEVRSAAGQHYPPGYFCRRERYSR